MAGPVVLVLLAALGFAGSSTGDPPLRRPGRTVAMVLVRDLTWADAPAALDGFARASLSMRTVKPRGDAADVYLTLGKGNRASALGGAGIGRIEVRPGGGLRLTDWADVTAGDRRSRFPGAPGSVGQALFEAGRSWALATGDPDAAAVAATAAGTVPASHAVSAEGLEAALVARPDALFVAASRSAVPRILDRLADTCTLVVSASTAAENRHLGVFAASPACGLGTGGVASPSTHHDHLVTLPDVTSTFLALAGVEAPPWAPGHPVTPAADVDRAALVERDLRTRTADRSRPVFVWLFIALHAAGAVAAVRWPRARTFVAAALLAIPAASFLGMLVPWWRYGTAAGVAAGGAIAAALAVPGCLLMRRDAHLGIGAMAAMTAGVVAVDALFGSPLQVDAPFGNSPAVGARFFGVGNIGSGFLVAGLLVAGGLAVDRWGRLALPWVSVALAAGAIAGGAPQFGADVGGVLFAVPAFGLLLLGVRRERIRAGHVALLGCAAILAVALFAAVDLALGAGDQTHLAKAFGEHGLVQEMLRKALLAAGTVRNPLGLVVAIALAALALTRYSPGARPAIRATSIAVVAAATLGSLLNDSGVIVAAAVYAVAWPAGVLVASHERQEVPTPV